MERPEGKFIMSTANIQITPTSYDTFHLLREKPVVLYECKKKARLQQDIREIILLISVEGVNNMSKIGYKVRTHFISQYHNTIAIVRIKLR